MALPTCSPGETCTHIHTHQGMHTRGHSPGQASAAQLLVGPSACGGECVCLCVRVRSWADVVCPSSVCVKCKRAWEEAGRRGGPEALWSRLRQEGDNSDYAMSRATVALSRAHPGSPEELGKKPCQGWGSGLCGRCHPRGHRAPTPSLCPCALVWDDQPPTGPPAETSKPF